MGAPKYTTRLSIPFPDDYDDDWYANEDGAGGRMDKLDELICAAIENPHLALDRIASVGYWDWDRVDKMTITGGDLVLRSPSGGTVTFASGANVTVADGEWMYFEVPVRPLTGSNAGTLLAAANVQVDASKVILGRAEGGKFGWIRNELSV